VTPEEEAERLEEPEERQYVVPSEVAGKRLDQAATALATDLSRAAAQRLILQGLCLLNGRVARRADRVASGDRLTVVVLPPEPTEVLPEEIPLAVVFEDRDLIVIDKPSGMVVHPAVGNPRGTLVNALLAHCRDLSGIGGELRPGIVHRLDKETSGLLVAAKSEAAHRGLAQQIAERSAKRTYRALVWGEPKPPRGRIDAPIARHPRHRQKMAVVEGGREAATRYRVLETFALGSAKGRRAISLVELDLETGRTHQIRVHMSHVGHPVLGDPLYGRPGGLPPETPTEVCEALAALHGQALHGQRLEFTHPVTGQRLAFETEPPADFRRTLEALRAAASPPSDHE
jgi:23S rRNA pseudouridine1911/1915/1917 synthase